MKQQCFHKIMARSNGTSERSNTEGDTGAEKNKPEISSRIDAEGQRKEFKRNIDVPNARHPIVL
jgi:hypothetical protein